jgi:hypothetical protein
MIDLSTITFDRYHTFAEFTTALKALAAAYPGLARLTSIGLSHGGREIWAMELTNQATGPADEKPGYYIDGNCHGQEVISSEVPLYTIWYALTQYGHDPLVTEVLDTRALYILPRINPDGAEWCITTPYRHVGNGHYPFWTEPATGHRYEDMDGDGYIVDMRVPDPGGEWKISAKDPRLMIPREPGEVGGVYYRVYPEGVIPDYDGVNVFLGRARHGNLNRQYPSHWGPEEVEYGAGQLPLNEPEAKAIAEFVLAHPNIAGAVAYHSHGGVILRQSSVKPDRELPPGDVRLFKRIGGMGAQVTGYPLISTFQDFTAETHHIRHGGFGDWLYEFLGIIPFTPELWDVETEAGVKKPQFFMERGRSEDEQLQLLAWAEANCAQDCKFFIDWRPFDHPQLGRVEIGGWDQQYVFRNPPPKFIAKVAHPVTVFTLRHAACSPLLRIHEVSATAMAPGLYKIEAIIANEGFLPTNLTTQALRLGLQTAVRARLELPAGVELTMGAAEQDLGQLAGYSDRPDPWNPWGPPWQPTRLRATWQVAVKGAGATQVRVIAMSQKGGTVAQEITLA